MKRVSTKANGYVTRNGPVYSTESVAKRPLHSVYCAAALKGAVARGAGMEGSFRRTKKCVGVGLCDIWVMRYTKYLPECTVSSRVPQSKYCKLYCSVIKSTYARVIYIKI